MLVRNCRLVQKDKIIETSIIIDEGIVKNLVKADNNIKAQRIIDAKGNLVIPGCIDTHFHSREPSSIKNDTDFEDFTSGTKAAAAGGYTTIFDMPVTGSPPTTNVQGFNEKKSTADSKSIVDYAFYGGAGFGNIDKIKLLANLGVIDFKIFTREIIPKDEQWRGTIIGPGGSESLFQIMSKVAETGRNLSIHCEDDRLTEFLKKEFKSKGIIDSSAYYKSAPNASEFLEVARCIKLAQRTKARIIIAHTSTSESINLVEKSKNEGLTIYCETCPHYLTLTDADMVNNFGPYGKTYPPLRTQKDQDALWIAINKGLIDFIGTDHAPHPISNKEKGWKNIFEAMPGIPGIETALSILLTQMNAGRLNIFNLVNLTSRNAARLFRIDHRKGDLDIGKDADFVIIDPKREFKFKEGNMYTRGSAKVFEGMKVKGIPILTTIRGIVVMEEGEVIGKDGNGQYIYPNPKVNL